MRFLILAIALAFTAPPALGQVRPELLQWTEQRNTSAQTRPGLIYELNWDVPQDDAEARRWKPILIGAGIGLTLGLAISAPWPWVGDDLVCIVDPPPPPPAAPPPAYLDTGCRPASFWDRPTGISIAARSLIVAGVGAAIGWVWSLGTRPIEGAP